MERDTVLHGIKVYHKSTLPQETVKLVNEYIVPMGFNFVYPISFGKPWDKELLMWFVKTMVDNKIYVRWPFVTGEEGKNHTAPCGFDEETAVQLKEMMGEYYVSHSLGEFGHEFACSGSKYWSNSYVGEHLQEALDKFMSRVHRDYDIASMGGKFKIMPTEQTSVMPYLLLPERSIPCLETPCGNPEVMLPLTRGCARTLNAPLWMTYIAHEWYAGVRDLDTLKMHRLQMIYDFCYMSGSNMFMLESGNNGLYSHDTAPENGAVRTTETGEERYGPNCETSVKYREVVENFSKFIKEDCRPKGGPKAKVAFVQGYLDGYSPWRTGSSLWNNFTNKDFGYSTPEFVWRLFDEITVKRNWCDTHNYGDVDLSGAPAYGTYDIVNATAGYDTFKRYDYLIFTGWNTMTEEIYENLKKFVENGGRLFMTAAHLNTSDKRDGEMKLIHGGDVSDLFGCTLDAENCSIVNDGFKFHESIVPEFLYPKDMWFDPLFSEGYIKYPDVKLTTAAGTGRLSQRFVEEDKEAMPVWLAENKVGKGYATLMTSLDYPGGCGYTIFKLVVREMLTASHRQCPIKVYGGDKLRFTVYEGDKVYLLNTDFDCPIHAVIDYGNEKREFTLKPREFKPVER